MPFAHSEEAIGAVIDLISTENKGNTMTTEKESNRTKNVRKQQGMKEHVCSMCGEKFFSRSSNVVRCEKCRVAYKKVYWGVYSSGDKDALAKIRSINRDYSSHSYKPRVGKRAKPKNDRDGMVKSNRCLYCGAPIYEDEHFCGNCRHEGYHYLYCHNHKTNGWDKAKKGVVKPAVKTEWRGQRVAGSGLKPLSFTPIN